MEDTSVCLKIDGVYKSFAKIENNEITTALENIDLEIEKDEFVCIVGESGCGKSTILRLIAGLIVPTRGEIFVNGEKVEGPCPKRGMVFQKPTLFPWLTVEDNIGFSLKMEKKKIVKGR